MVDLRPTLMPLRAYRGDDFSLGLRFLSSRHPIEPINLSAWEDLAAEVRRTQDGDLLATLTVTVTEATEGRLTIEAAASVIDALPTSCRLWWDFERAEAGLVRTLLAGTFWVSKDTTHA
jgi:hypothetical protein